MSNTLVIQSHTHPLPVEWIKSCLNSVEHWASINRFDYIFHGDELFDHIDKQFIQKYQNQIVIVTDIARLKILQYYLERDYETVIWCDADFLIFRPNAFYLPESSYALGREVWIQTNSQNKLISNTKVHNAFMMFRKENNFLNFYVETAERILKLNKGSTPPQFIGPKLLTALHNIAQCPIAEHAGMLSPLVIKDICAHGGSALDLFIKNSKQPIFAANLCSSLFYNDEISLKEIETCISILSSQTLFNS